MFMCFVHPTLRARSVAASAPISGSTFSHSSGPPPNNTYHASHSNRERDSPHSIAD